jgi:hypothetical protein
MPTVIRLDAGALSHLLDVLGEDFLLELRLGILNETLGKHIKSVTPKEVLDVVNKAVKEEVKNSVGEAGWRTITLNPKLERNIKVKVERAVTDIIREKLTDPEKLIDTAIEHHITDPAHRAKYRIDARLSKIIDEHIQEAVAAKVALALDVKDDPAL